MSRPKAKSGVTLSDKSWNIHDAGAFRVGRSATVHHVNTFPTGVGVTGKCGVVGFSDYFATYPAGFTGHDHASHPAEWAAGEVDCKTCKERAR
jgi:hypothetical protein